MKVVAVVPVKLNNVRTPGKNTKLLSDGTPLIHLIQRTLLSCKTIDDIYVYCSKAEIKKFLLPGVKYIAREERFDTADADVIDMMREFSLIVDSDIYVQSHATTPFLLSSSIDKAISRIIELGCDSSFAVKKIQDFLWIDQKPVNYNPVSIPRTQDMKPYFMETTGLYIYKKSVIQDMHRRIGNNPYLLEVSELESLDIDTPLDFKIVDAVYDKIIKEMIS